MKTLIYIILILTKICQNFSSIQFFLSQLPFTLFSSEAIARISGNLQSVGISTRWSPGETVAKSVMQNKHMYMTASYREISIFQTHPTHFPSCRLQPECGTLETTSGCALLTNCRGYKLSAVTPTVFRGSRYARIRPRCVFSRARETSIPPFHGRP